jgi:hypothetical protein
MRVNSAETIQKAIDYRERSGKSWLQLIRDPKQQQHSRDSFSGRLNSPKGK